MVKTRFLHDFNTILARFVSKNFRLGMAKIKVFVYAANADADTRAMTLAPRTFVPAR